METPVVKRGRRRQQAYLVLLSGVMALVSLIAVVGTRGSMPQTVVGWLGFVLFGAAALLFTYQVLHPPGLYLDASGFVVRGATFKRRHEWADVSAFVVARRPYGSTSRLLPLDAVYYDNLKPAASRWAKRWKRLNKSVAGHDLMMLPDNYGMTAEGLADELNRRRDEALAHR
jgi:hypothetical protein